MMKRCLARKVVSPDISALLILLVFFILVPPATAVLVKPGTPNKTSVTTGTTITFSNVNLTIRGLERIPVNNLTFKIFNNAIGSPIIDVVLETRPDYVFIVNLEGNVIFLNAAPEDMLDVVREEYIREFFTRFVLQIESFLDSCPNVWRDAVSKRLRFSLEESGWGNKTPVLFNA